MINVSLVTLLATWAADASTGVNAQLLALPAGETPPVPPPVTVLSMYTDRQAAEGMFDDLRLDQGPFLLFAPADRAQFAGVLHDGLPDTHDVAAMYIDGRSESHIALQNAHRTLRALRRVIALQFNLRSNAGVDVGGCYVERPTTIAMQTGDPREGASQITASVFLPFPSLDRWALGADA